MRRLDSANPNQRQDPSSLLSFILSVILFVICSLISIILQLLYIFQNSEVNVWFGGSNTDLRMRLSVFNMYT